MGCWHSTKGQIASCHTSYQTDHTVLVGLVEGKLFRKSSFGTKWLPGSFPPKHRSDIWVCLIKSVLPKTPMSIIIFPIEIAMDGG